MPGFVFLIFKLFSVVVGIVVVAADVDVVVVTVVCTIFGESGQPIF